METTDTTTRGDFLTASEAAAFLGIKRSTLNRYTFRRAIPFYKLSHSVNLFRQSELTEWIERHKIFAVDQPI